MGLSTNQSAYLAAAAFLAFAGFVWVNRDRPAAAPSAAPVTSSTPSPTETHAEQPAAPMPAPKRKLPESVAEAIAEWRPEMADTKESFSDGAEHFALWAMNHLAWGDLQTIKESSIALVAKDVDEERGRRLCVSGSVIEIQAQKLGAQKVHHGGLMVGADVVRFTAVGSTGKIVAHGWARFCGIVAGIYSYSNTGGGTTHSVHTVGMFDLAENKPPPPATNPPPPPKFAAPKSEPPTRVWNY